MVWTVPLHHLLPPPHLLISCLIVPSADCLQVDVYIPSISFGLSSSFLLLQMPSGNSDQQASVIILILRCKLPNLFLMANPVSSPMPTSGRYRLSLGHRSPFPRQSVPGGCRVRLKILVSKPSGDHFRTSCKMLLPWPLSNPHFGLKTSCRFLDCSMVIISPVNLPSCTCSVRWSVDGSAPNLCQSNIWVLSVVYGLTTEICEILCNNIPFGYRFPFDISCVKFPVGDSAPLAKVH